MNATRDDARSRLFTWLLVAVSQSSPLLCVWQMKTNDATKHLHLPFFDEFGFNRFRQWINVSSLHQSQSSFGKLMELLHSILLFFQIAHFCVRRIPSWAVNIDTFFRGELDTCRSSLTTRRSQFGDWPTVCFLNYGISWACACQNAIYASA